MSLITANNVLIQDQNWV